MTASLSYLEPSDSWIGPTDRTGRGSRPVRVLMTLDAVGGVWRYGMDLARALKPHGVSCLFVGLGPPPAREQAAEARRLGSLVWLDEPLDWMVEHERALERIPKALQRLAREGGADLLHLNLPSQAAGLDVNLPVVVVSHSCVVTWWQAVREDALPQDWAWQRDRNRAGFDRADIILAPSRAHADLLERCYGDIPRPTVVHNGIGPVAGDPEKERFAFAAARWWDEAKNADLLERAATVLEWPVIMAGPLAGPDGQVVALRRARSIGAQPHSEILRYLARAAVAVSPSIYEPFGLVAAEAARAGAALVLSDIPTYRELWEGAALFVDPHDPQHLVHTLDSLLTDPARRTQLGQRARARSRRFSPERQAASMLGIYGALCREERGSAASGGAR